MSTWLIKNNYNFFLIVSVTLTKLCMSFSQPNDSNGHTAVTLCVQSVIYKEARKENKVTQALCDTENTAGIKS